MNRTKSIGLMLGPVLFALILLIPAPDGVSEAGWRVTALALLMASWWATEALPIPAASLLPIFLLPLLDVSTTRAATLPYAEPVIFLLLGGFLAAMAMQRHGLHRRIALSVLARSGDHPGALMAGFMAISGFLSMWISNTATVLMIIPIAITVAETVLGDSARGHRFTTALLIGCAWAASIGGLGTYIGTPPNLFVKGFIERETGQEILFLQWMGFAIPIVLVMIPAAWVVLAKICFRFEARGLSGGAAVVQTALSAMGPMSRAEKRVSAVLIGMAVLWATRQFLVGLEPLTDLLPFVARLSDTHIAVIGGFLMFILPAGDGERLLNWEQATTLPWGVILLFGGGLSLAAAIRDSGLAAALGTALSLFGDVPILAIMFAVVALVIFLTELTSNTATTAALVPVLAALAATAGIDPLLLAAPVAMAASCAFMLPVATGPNAVVFSTGQVRVPDMMRAGLLLNLIGCAVVTLICYSLLPILFVL